MIHSFISFKVELVFEMMVFVEEETPGYHMENPWIIEQKLTY